MKKFSIDATTTPKSVADAANTLATEAGAILQQSQDLLGNNTNGIDLRLVQANALSPTNKKWKDKKAATVAQIEIYKYAAQALIAEIAMAVTNTRTKAQEVYADSTKVGATASTLETKLREVENHAQLAEDRKVELEKIHKMSTALLAEATQPRFAKGQRGAWMAELFSGRVLAGSVAALIIVLCFLTFMFSPGKRDDRALKAEQNKVAQLQKDLEAANANNSDLSDKLVITDGDHSKKSEMEAELIELRKSVEALTAERDEAKRQVATMKVEMVPLADLKAANAEIARLKEAGAKSAVTEARKSVVTTTTSDIQPARMRNGGGSADSPAAPSADGSLSLTPEQILQAMKTGDMVYYTREDGNPSYFFYNDGPPKIRPAYIARALQQIGIRKMPARSRQGTLVNWED